MASSSTSSAYTEIMAGPNLHSKSCHQCRQKTMKFVACKNIKKNDKICAIGICDKCLLNRYGERVEEVATFGDWICPKCRGICNCSLCRKKNGQQPTGTLVRTAKAAGFSSVAEMLETSGSQNVDFAKVEMDGVASSSKNGENFDGEVVLNGIAGVEHNGAGTSAISKKKVEHEEFQLPHAAALISVTGVEMPSEDVGHALQFLEFYSTFGKVLGEKEDPQCVLHDLFHGRGHSSAVEFQIKLFKIILGLEEHKEFPLSMTCSHENAWLDALRECVLESQYIWKDLPIDSLERIDGYLERINKYDELDSSEKIRVLTFLCDEALGSQKLRKWITQQHHLFVEEKQKARREKLRDEEDELSECCNRDKIAEPSPSEISEPEATEADDMELLEARSAAPQTKKTCNAVRTQPLGMDQDSHIFWRLRYPADSKILVQDVEIETGIEKWSEYSAVDTQKVEKYANNLRKSRRRRRRSVKVARSDSEASDLEA